MKTAVINIKTDTQTKQKAKKIAEELGLSLGSVLNALLCEFVRSRRLEVGTEELSAYAIKELKASEEDYNAGRYQSFNTVGNAVAFLDDISKHGYGD